MRVRVFRKNIARVSGKFQSDVCLITLIFLALLCSVKMKKIKQEKLEKPATANSQCRQPSWQWCNRSPHVGALREIGTTFLGPTPWTWRATDPPPVDSQCRSEKMHFSKGEVVVGIPRVVRTKGMDCRCKQPLRRCNCCMCVRFVCMCWLFGKQMPRSFIDLWRLGQVSLNTRNERIMGAFELGFFGALCEKARLDFEIVININRLWLWWWWLVFACGSGRDLTGKWV